MTWAIIGLSVLFISMLAPALIWLHAEINEGKHIRDRLDEQMKLASQYESERDVEVAAHAVTKDELATEKNLRAIAEAQRNEAQRKARAYLAQNLAHASDKEITDAVGEIFSTPLSLLPGSELERP